MSPSPNQFPQSSNNSDQAQTSERVIRRPNPPKPAPMPAPTPPPPLAATAATPASSNASSESEVGEAKSSERDFDRRQQPIPPPSEPMQYRAIGLVRGKYTPSEEQFTRGTLVATDETPIDAVLLGRVMSLVKNHLDLATDHLWVVYPRTRQQDGDLHVQIVGVWEPEKLDKTSTSTPESADETTESESSNAEILEPANPSPPAEDGYFSIRGEVVFQMQDDQTLIVKIKQSPRQDEDKPKYFKLTLKGILEKKAVGYFWDFQIQREGNNLLIKEATEIGPTRPRKPRKPGFKGGKGGGAKGRKPWKPNQSNRPGGPPNSQPISDKPAPRPIKRQQPSSDAPK